MCSITRLTSLFPRPQPLPPFLYSTSCTLAAQTPPPRHKLRAKLKRVRMPQQRVSPRPPKRAPRVPTNRSCASPRSNDDGAMLSRERVLQRLQQLAGASSDAQLQLSTSPCTLGAGRDTPSAAVAASPVLRCSLPDVVEEMAVTPCVGYRRPTLCADGVVLNEKSRAHELWKQLVVSDISGVPFAMRGGHAHPVTAARALTAAAQSQLHSQYDSHHESQPGDAINAAAAAAHAYWPSPPALNEHVQQDGSVGTAAVGATAASLASAGSSSHPPKAEVRSSPRPLRSEVLAAGAAAGGRLSPRPRAPPGHSTRRVDGATKATSDAAILASVRTALKRTLRPTTRSQPPLAYT